MFRMSMFSRKRILLEVALVAMAMAMGDPFPSPRDVARARHKHGGRGRGEDLHLKPGNSPSEDAAWMGQKFLMITNDAGGEFDAEGIPGSRSTVIAAYFLFTFLLFTSNCVF